MEPQPQVVTRGQHHVYVRRKVRQQPSELSECLRRIQLVQIIDNQGAVGRAGFTEETMAHAVAPQAIADTIAFLVSDAAAPVSGAILPAYGA